MAKILLAHGILGFGSVLPRQRINYFNCIRKLYEEEGHEVHQPNVPPLGSLEARADMLEAEIPEHWLNSHGDIFMLAHSMGGLDCRRILARNRRLRDKVRRLVTISTPHYGSPVADKVLNHDPLTLPTRWTWLFRLFSDDLGALHDLRTRNKLQDSDAETVEYLCIGCNASTVHPASPVFAATALLGQFGRLANDGVVSLDSSSKTGNLRDLFRVWPVDHGGAIGWPSGISIELDGLVMDAANPPPEHLDRYLELLPHLIA